MGLYASDLGNKYKLKLKEIGYLVHHQCMQEVTVKAFNLKMFACVSK